MESKTRIVNISYDKFGCPLVTFRFKPKDEAEIQELKQVDVDVIVKKHSEKRSLDANAYAWTLMGKISKETNLPKDEVYRQYIRELGDAQTIICTQAKNADRIIRDWEKKGLGWQTETFSSNLPGCINIILYEGSSEFDTATMRKLIELIKQDCEALDIETETPEEINRRIERWNNNA